LCRFFIAGYFSYLTRIVFSLDTTFFANSSVYRILKTVCRTNPSGCRIYFFLLPADLIFVFTFNLLTMKTNILLIRIGGALNIVFLLFHLSFYWLFNWKNTLACLNLDNWAIYHIFNVICDSILLMFVIVSFFQTEKLITEVNGRRILFCISFFYIIRIGSEFIFWGIQGLSTLIIVLVCLAPAILYGLPLLRRNGI
jgi:hypothetical protein